MANVPKHKYKNSNLQKLITWSRSPISSVSWLTCQNICSQIVNYPIIATHTQIEWAMHIKNKSKYDTHPNKNLQVNVNYKLSTPDLRFLPESCMKLGPGIFTVLPRNYPFRGPTLRANPAHSPTLQTPRL